MEKKFKLGVIGAGFMSSAIVSGAVKSGFISKTEVLVSDPSNIALEKMQNNNGVSVTSDNLKLANSCEFVLFAVKPQSFSEVAASINGCACKKFISIMAGVKKTGIKTKIGNDFKIARCMPNTPCSVGFGAVGIDLSDYNDNVDAEFIKGLFSSFASVVTVSEDKLNVVTGISGSSPAYFYMFAKSLIDAGVKRGLSEDDAETLVVNTLIGSGKMLLNRNNKTVEELISAVCSKGGTTIEAVKVYEEGGLYDLSEKAVNACVNRATELENV